MAVKAELRPLVGYLQQLAVTAAHDDMSDRRLLEQLRTADSEDAFRLLVHRHEALVLSVCQRACPACRMRRIAFRRRSCCWPVRRARFAGRNRWRAGCMRLPLALRPSCVCVTRDGAGRGPGGRTDRTRRGSSRRSGGGGRRGDGALPERCRTPLLLCYLQGQPHAQAAVRLGLSLRTLERRLQAGKALLRDRLVRVRADSLGGSACLAADA